MRGGQFGGDAPGVPVRQSEEDDVVPGQDLRGGGLDGHVRIADQMRLMGAKRRSRAAGTGHRCNVEHRRAGEQPEDFSPGIAGSPRHGYGQGRHMNNHTLSAVIIH
ncbi:hypothetical protein GCM10027079_26390 [Sediminivirga luteola]|uniref:Uncharacterized protein n=1 Tax=Sediminivirga luteola TaxID=1774748 RepID=A0A8J2U0I7_9MICO|nr:hypothetical protein GCM10011333_29920 [Sediminivirga luteola]